jgi:hypothetical protein
MDKYLSQHYLDAHCFANVKSKINVAIVMYSQIRLLEELCGPLSQFKIIHLLRAADAVARSLVQLAANKAYYGRKVKAHYCLGERQLPNAPYDKLEVERIRHEVVLSQNKHTEYLASCKNVLVLHYEDLTQNQQVNRLPEHIASKILAFLCLDYCPLDNPLQKSGPGAL